MKEHLQKRARQESATGSTLPSEILSYRCELVESALLAGVALWKAHAMGPFLEKYGHRLTSRAHLGKTAYTCSTTYRKRDFKGGI